MLPSRNLSGLLPYVMPHAKGAPFPQATQALHDAAIEFCRRSRLWRLPTSTVVSASGDVSLAPQFTSIVEIEDATFNGEFLEIRNWDDPNYVALRAAPTGSVPLFITQKTLSAVEYLPFAAGTLRTLLILQPAIGEQYGGNAENALENAFHVVPDLIFGNYAQVLAHGALARLLNAPNMPFSNPEAAGMYGKLFEDRLVQLEADHMRFRRRTRLRLPSNYQ